MSSTLLKYFRTRCKHLELPIKRLYIGRRRELFWAIEKRPVEVVHSFWRVLPHAMIFSSNTALSESKPPIDRLIFCFCRRPPIKQKSICYRCLTHEESLDLLDSRDGGRMANAFFELEGIRPGEEIEKLEIILERCYCTRTRGALKCMT